VADRHAVVDIRNSDAVLQTIRLEGVVPSGAISFVTDAGMLSAAHVREEYGLRGPRPELALRLTNKCRQRAVWTSAGLPCPEWFCVSSLKEARAAIEALEGRIILKPSDSAGSRGIHVFNKGEDWESNFEDALRLSSGRACILERFVPGTEFAIETFAHHERSWVLAISQKRKVPGTQESVAIELSTPSLDEDSVEAIGRLAVNALMALGHHDGPGHTEILRDAAGSLWLVEAAGRGGGFMVADGIVPRANGFNLSKACAVQAAGLEPDVPSEVRRPFVLRFLPSRRGTVRSIRGLEQANSIPNVECQALVKVGDRVEDARSDGGRLAYILTWGDDRTQVFSSADLAEQHLEIEIQDCQAS
jgi:biotin carboxylase